MMLSGRPLLATKPDQRYVVERSELASFVASLSQGLNTALFGAPGSGKTTLLRQAARSLAEGSRIRAIYLNASQFEDPLTALVATQDALRGDELPPFAVRDVPRMFESQPSDQLRDPALRIVRSLHQDDPVVVMLDGLSPTSAHALFGQMRDDLWATGITWAVAGDVAHRAGYLAPPADAFFERVIVLGPLSDEQQMALIRKRREAGDPDWLIDVRVSSGNPRSLLASLRDAQDATDAASAGLLAARAARERVAADLGRLHSALLAEIEDGAAVSASDRDLLRRFGISRQRAQQVLNELESRGLVESGTRSSAESGRPRKVYWRVRSSS
jgi:energy-coupling factor transporter ATP-binding protein EcfA2